MDAFSAEPITQNTMIKKNIYIKNTHTHTRSVLSVLYIINMTEQQKCWGQAKPDNCPDTQPTVRSNPH